MSMSDLPEIAELKSWIGEPPRHPGQTHGLNESDSEVVLLEDGTYLATTIDTVSEEIAVGLYRDAYRIGWVTAMASLSDLAAVGADPVGMLLSAEWSESFGAERKPEVGRGFSDALRRCGTFWLGGDSGRGSATVLGGVAIGTCRSRPLSRMGMEPGDYVCMTGKVGNGPALAIRFLLGQPEDAFPESNYLPCARIDAGRALRGLARSAMDTSDGVVSTLGTLSLLNGAELELEWKDELISGPARAYCEEHAIPLWLLWQVEHGDYQLVATVAPENLEKARQSVPDLEVIGRVAARSEDGGARPSMSLRLGDGRVEPIDPGLARTLLLAHRNSLSRALRALIEDAQRRKLP